MGILFSTAYARVKETEDMINVKEYLPISTICAFASVLLEILQSIGGHLFYLLPQGR